MLVLSDTHQKKHRHGEALFCIPKKGIESIVVQQYTEEKEKQYGKELASHFSPRSNLVTWDTSIDFEYKISSA